MSSEGMGVYGESSKSRGVGVYGEASESRGKGVVGVATNGDDEPNWGGYFVSKGDGGSGIYASGHGINSRGVTGNANNAGGAGVYGGTINPSSYGVHGKNPNGYAGYFEGKTKVTENLLVEGNVGIGIPNPEAKLEVNSLTRIGGINWPSTGKGMELAYNPDLNRGYIQAYDRDSSEWGELYLGDGSVGIGAGSLPSSYKLTVNGSAAKEGGGEWSTFSDVSLKDVLGNYENGLNEILQIKPITYRYKEKNELGLSSDSKYVGLVAQEVQKVIPEAVEENQSGYLMVNGSPINYAMLNGIKELYTEIQKLKKRVKELEKAQRK